MSTATKSEKRLQELQRYVPFLEGLIKKLEAHPLNSREAQLTKMKQLHGLLTGSAPNLKPETLDKCESVLIRLQGKLNNVTVPTNLEISLAKLKSVNKIEKSSSNSHHDRPLSSHGVKNELITKPKEAKPQIVDYKDHDYRPHEELQGNLYQRRTYRGLNEPTTVKKEYHKPSSSGSHNRKNIVEDVLKKPPLSADDISHLLHDNTDEDEENLDSKDINELYQLQNSLVDKMKKETDHGLVDNDYTGHNRLAFKYPRKKIDPMLSPGSSGNECDSLEQPKVYSQNNTSAQAKPSSIYANITTLAPIPQYNLDNSYLKQEWFPMQGQMNTPIRNMSTMYGNEPNLSSMQAQPNLPSVYANDPRLRQKMQQQQQQQQQHQQVPMQPQPLLNNQNNYYPWYQNNMSMGPHNQMAGHNQSSYYMQQQQQHHQQQQFQQQKMSWGSSSSSSTMFTDQKPPHQNNFNNSYNNNRFGKTDTSMGSKHYDESYKKFHPKLNDMVERKIYEKSKKSQHNQQNNIPIHLLDSPKFESSKLKTPIVHDITADDWITDELEKEKESISNGKVTTTKVLNEKDKPPKEKVLETQAREINISKDKAAKVDNEKNSIIKDKKEENNDIIFVDNVSPTTEASKNSENVSPEFSKQEEKIENDRIEKFLINLKEDSSSNILTLLSKVLDENKFNQIKSILEDDHTTTPNIEETIAQAENKKNQTDNSDEIVSSTYSVGDDDDKSDKEDISENAEKTIEGKKDGKSRRRNELDKLNFDIKNMFICKGVLTSTGRRMCTILKDDAYTEPREKEKKTTVVQNNKNKKRDTDGSRITRRNSVKNCSVVMPKLNLNKELKLSHHNNENDKIKDKTVTKSQNSIPTKSIGLRRKTRRKRNRGKQWASGVIIRKQPKRKQNNDEDAEKQTDDEGIKADKSISDVDEEGIETEVEDNTPDDRSITSELSTVATVVAPPAEIIKNVDKNYYMGNKTNKRCALCSKGCSMRRLPKHYITKHSGYEVFISRLNPNIADIFLNKLEERCGTRTFHKMRPVIKFSCYFCDSLCFLSVEDWISHIASHTGEYLRKCSKCPWQSSFSYVHQCTKKGVAIVIKEFKFEGNHFHGYLCSGCNYVQLQEENVVKHIKNEHQPNEKDIKILKINLLNVPPVRVIKRGRKKLSTVETVEEPVSPFEITTPKVLRSSKRAVPIEEPKIEPPDILSDSPDAGESDKNFHAKEKEIIGEMEMRTNSSNSIVDRLKARFKENVMETPINVQSVNQPVEKERPTVTKQSESLTQIEPTATEIVTMKSSIDDDVDNKSNDSEWEDFDEANSCDSNTSLSKLQAEIETSSTKPGALTNTLVRLLDQIKAVPEKRKSPLSPEENDTFKTKKHRVDFRELLKQTKSTESESVTPNISETNETETKVIPEIGEPIKIKEEFDESVQIKTEPECLENEQEEENSVLYRIERICYKIKKNTFPLSYTFICKFEGCEFKTTDSIEFTNHINGKQNEFWEGFCYICESYVRADENMPLSLEIKHMLEVHLKMNISINVEESVKAPSLSLKKLPGDLLSSSMYARMSFTTSEPTSEMLLIKPWTGYQNQKTHANCEEMLKENNLSNLYKCMGMNCSFSTGAVIEYLEHIKNHEKDAEDQLIVNPCNLDTTSWLECSYCDIFADTYYDLVQHVTEKHKNSFYQCGYCFYRSFLATNVVMHRYKHHNDLPLSVLLCDKMENLPKIIFEKILISRTNNIRALHCNIESCKNKKFYALDLFLNHNTKHNQNRYLCEFCSVSVDSNAILSHLVTHGIGLFECIYCRFATNKIQKIQMHMCDKHPTKLLFITLRMFRHPQTNAMPHDIAGDISSIYLVNFGQRLTINFTQIHSMIVNNKSLDLLENERPKVFPSTFESGCLLNIAECNKLIAGSSVQILEINTTGSAIPIKPAFSSNSTDQTEDTIETEDIAPVRQPVVTLKDKITAPAKDPPMRRLSIISAASLSLKAVPSIGELAKTTAKSDGMAMASSQLSLIPARATILKPVPSYELASTAKTDGISVISSSRSQLLNAVTSTTTVTAITLSKVTPSIATITLSKVTPSIATTTLNVSATTNSLITSTKECPSKTLITSNPSSVIVSAEKSTTPVVEMAPPTTLPLSKEILERKEISEDRLEEIATKISIDMASSRNTKFQCLIPGCNIVKPSFYDLNLHLLEHNGKQSKQFTCYFCSKQCANSHAASSHLTMTHTYRFFCYYCSFKSPLYRITLNHVAEMHKIQAVISKPITKPLGNGTQIFVIAPRNISDENFNQYKYELIEKYNRELRISQNCYLPEDISSLPREEINLNVIFCSVCNYGTKVRKNMERHLMFHLNEVPVPKIGPINPVPCLTTTERHFDKMKNLACSSQEDRERLKIIENAPKYVTETQRFTCGANNCQYLSIDENMLNCHLKTLHYSELEFKCVHCKPVQIFDCPDNYVNHLRLHDVRLFKCNMCDYFNTQRQYIEKHLSETHNSNLMSIVVIREEGTPSTAISANVALNNSESGSSNVNNNSNGLTWVCNSCTYVSATKKQVMDHNTHTHNFKSQFLCKICGYRSNIRPNVEYHLTKKHPDTGDNQVFTTYSRSDEPESSFVDNSPLWRRDSNRIKHIRGILFEDEEMAADSDSNIETILSDDENDEDDEPEPTGMFCCNYCNYMASYRGVKMHHNEKHRDREFKSKPANLTTTSAPDKSDANDEKIKQSSTMYLCAYCPLRQRSIKKILEHWKDKHQHPKVKSNNANTRPLPFQFRLTRLARCYYCHEKYGYHELSKHIPRRHPGSPIVSQHYLSSKRCGECDYKCEFSETSLVAHCKSEHSDAKFRTLPSDMLADNFLSRYMNMDIEQFYYCTECNMESDSKAELEQHVRRMHKDKPTTKVELKANKLMYYCNYCKHNSTDEFTIMKHIMKLHSPTCEKSPSNNKVFYNAMRFKNNIDKFDQIKLIFPNGLVLNKADVVKTPYGGYDHIIKRLTVFDMPSPLSKKRQYDAASGPSAGESRLQPNDIKRLKFTECIEDNPKPLKSYDLSKIYTTMKIGEKDVSISCEKFAALFDINPVLKLDRI